MIAPLELRREARDHISHPGKFEGEPPITYILWELSMDQSYVDDTISHDSFGWWGLMGRYIIHESDNGFVTSERFASVETAMERFEEIRDIMDTPNADGD